MYFRVKSLYFFTSDFYILCNNLTRHQLLFILYISKIHLHSYIWPLSQLKFNFFLTLLFFLRQLQRAIFSCWGQSTDIHCANLPACTSFHGQVVTENTVQCRTQCTLKLGWAAAGKGAAALQAILVTLFLFRIVEMSRADTLKKVSKYNLLEMWGNPPQ